MAAVDTVDVAGRPIAYRRAGSGPPLLLVHGAVSDGRVWRRQLAEMSDRFDVVVWDAPGCGASADPPESFRLGDYADVLAGFAEALALGPSHVVGHSFGGALALELFARHPARVSSLVLVGGYAGWAGSLPADAVQARLAFALDLADRLPGWSPESMPGLFSDRVPPEVRAELRQIMEEIRPAATRSMAHALAEADLRPLLPTVDVPTLLLYGDADERAPRSVADGLHAGIPGSTLVMLPGLGHEAPLEDPDAFHRELRAFLP
jgi:pimeloyl-ACP methyl ester carboxylesterase